MDVLAVATALREIALLVALDGDEHRSRAYERAARTVEAAHDMERRIADGTLTELPGIGASIAATIHELVTRGTAPALEKLQGRWPPVVLELARMSEVGPPKARRVFDELAPRDLDDVAAMAEAGRIRTVRGFGKVSEAKLLAALRDRGKRGEQLLLVDARRLAAALAGYVAGDPAAIAVHVAGDVRRWIEVVDRIALVVITREPAAILDRVRRQPQVTSLDDGMPAVAKLADGARLDLYAAPPERAGAAMVIATGSDEHVAQVRARCAAGGIDLETLEASDEAAVYAAIGCRWLPPEVRDGDDELVRAAAGEDFGDLLTIADVRGAVHCHTTYSDGRHSIADMAAAADARRLAFITITDHSQAAAYANGLTPDRLRDQWDELAAVQAATPVRLIRGTEADILADGALDFGVDLLRQLDVVIASVHERHKLDRDAMTRRLVTAMRQPIFKIWGHALGRMITRRDPIDCDVDQVLDAIAESPAAIELNGDPHRLDLEPTLARRAHARGARFVVSTDAHATGELDYLEYSVAMARRARLRPADVLNTRPPDEFLAAVRPSR